MFGESRKNYIFGLNERLMEQERIAGLKKPRHTKKDYELLHKTNVKDIFDSATITQKKVAF